MPTLTTLEANGLRNAVKAEHESKRAAANVRERFSSVLVFENLEKSAARHITTLCETLHASEERPPVLAPAAETSPATLVEELEAAAGREHRKASIYGELLHTGNTELKNTVLPLWQSVSHLHLTAIADQLRIERSGATFPTADVD